MMWGAAVATSLLVVAGQVSAGAASNGGALVRKDDSMEHNMKRYVDALVEPVEKRQSTSMNTTNWGLETTAACTSALSLMNGTANNPSGMAVCYNIPTLDSATGVFEADLRLYMIAAPTGDFANIASDNVMVGLNYAGATVSPVNSSTLVKARSEESLISWPRGKRASTPTEAQAYAFVGQINKAQLTSGMTNATLERLVTPTVSLTGTSSSGQLVNTTLTMNEATFVYGVFSKAVSDGTTFKKSQDAIPPIQTLVVATDAPLGTFQLPGTAILIFPIGAIITGIWTVLFCATIAYGTFGRMQFRDQFKRRTAVATKGNLARI